MRIYKAADKEEANVEEKSQDYSEELEWEMHYNSRNKSWRIETNVNDDLDSIN